MNSILKTVTQGNLICTQNSGTARHFPLPLCTTTDYTHRHHQCTTMFVSPFTVALLSKLTLQVFYKVLNCLSLQSRVILASLTATHTVACHWMCGSKTVRLGSPLLNEAIEDLVKNLQCQLCKQSNCKFTHKHYGTLMMSLSVLSRRTELERKLSGSCRILCSAAELQCVTVL